MSRDTDRREFDCPERKHLRDRAPLVGDDWYPDPTDPASEVRYSYGRVVEVRPRRKPTERVPGASE